jgi:hypothetical protein
MSVTSGGFDQNSVANRPFYMLELTRKMYILRPESYEYDIE